MDPGGTSKPPSRRGDVLGSPLALSAFDPTSRKPLLHMEVWASQDAFHLRIGRLADKARKFMDTLIKFYPDATFEFYHEEFVMMGKQGRDFQRLIGAVIARVPASFGFGHVQNTTVKAVVGDHGGASKQQVAAGVLGFFDDDAGIKDLIEQKRWDALDAYAIGIAGHLVKESTAK